MEVMDFYPLLPTTNNLKLSNYYNKQQKPNPTICFVAKKLVGNYGSIISSFLDSETHASIMFKLLMSICFKELSLNVSVFSV
jgi:hypothetical protein